MAMKKLTGREQQIFIVAAVLLLVYAGYGVVYRSAKEKFSALDEQIEAKNFRLEKNQRILNKQKNIERVYQQLIQDNRQTRPDEQEMTGILAEIEAVANEIALPISDMKPQKVRKEDFYNKFSVNLTMEGDLTPILHIVYLLENKPHLFDIDEIRLEKSSAGSGKMKCLLTMSRILVP